MAQEENRQAVTKLMINNLANGLEMGHLRHSEGGSGCSGQRKQYAWDGVGHGGIVLLLK